MLKKSYHPHFSLPNMLMALALISYFLRFMLDWNFVFQSAAWLLFEFFPFIYVIKIRPDVARKLFFFFVVDGIALFNLIVNGSHAPFYIGILFATQWWGAFLYVQRRKLSFIEPLCTVFIFYLLYRVATTPKTLISTWQYGIKLSALVWQNTVSIFLCEFLSYVMIYRFFANKGTYYALLIVSLLTAVICGGMGGILSTVVYFIGLVILNKDKDIISFKRVVLLIVLGFSVIFLFGDYNEVLRAVTDDNSRFYIWTNYLKSIVSLKDLIVGANVGNDPFLVKLNNMHNTFVNYHFCYGLIPFLVFCWRHIVIVKYCIQTKKHLFLIVMAVTTLRAFTDEADFSFAGIWTFLWLMACDYNDNMRLKLLKEN